MAWLVDSWTLGFIVSSLPLLVFLGIVHFGTYLAAFSHLEFGFSVLEHYERGTIVISISSFGKMFCVNTDSPSTQK